jgi:uncharacterized membrane protein
MSERRAESNFFLRYWEIIVFGIAIIFSAGGLLEFIISNPSTTYPYKVGAGGFKGLAGTLGNDSSIGGCGVIIVEEYYQ